MLLNRPVAVIDCAIRFSSRDDTDTRFKSRGDDPRLGSAFDFRFEPEGR